MEIVVAFVAWLLFVLTVQRSVAVGFSCTESSGAVATSIERREALQRTGLGLGILAQTLPAHASPSSSLALEARDQLDLVVQACSVQAWADAYDLVSEVVLNDVGLPKESEEAGIISNGVGKLREKLQGVSSLPTKDAVEVMSIGTQTRSALDKYLANSKQQ